MLLACSSENTPGGGSGNGGAPAGGSGTGGATTAQGGSGTGGSGTGGAPGAGGSGTGGSGTGGATTAQGGSGTGGSGTGGTTSAGGASGSSNGGSNAGAGGAKGGAGGASGGGGTTAGAGGASGGSGGATGFSLTSPNHAEGAKFASKYTCADKGFNGSIMPKLDWTDGPSGTKSYAITFIDTTLSKGGGSMADLGYHWEIHNIPATTHSLPEALSGTQVTALGAKQNREFLGPCPGANMNHNYEFTIYALSTEMITITGSGTGAVKDAEMKLEANNLAKAKLKGTSDAKAP